MKIETYQTSNPTPNRNWDWCATFEGYEPDEPIGYGATPELATAELLEQVNA
jgi:hypothetical protein